jgi:hypothetical protein
MPIEDLLKDFYEVPDYQREYVWKTEHVEQLLNDIHREFELRSNSNSPEYFIGTIVTYFQADEDYFELIDGQQRVTTIYAILCALRDLFIENNQDVEGISGQLRAMKYDRKGKGKPQHRVKLQYPDSQDVLIRLCQTRDEMPLGKIETSTRSATNLVQAYVDARTFLLDSLQGDPELIREFWAYLTKSVKLIRIKTASRSRALWIFETINKRGRGLDAMDLLKNLLFRSAEDEQFETLKLVWKALADTLYSAADESPMKFMRHYVLANHATQKIQADKIYDWMVDPENKNRPNYWDDPIAFANELLTAAQAYKSFSEGRLESGKVCRYLKNIWHLAHSASQHQMLLLAARRAPESAMIRLAEETEKLYFVFLLTHQSPNKFESDFVEWAALIRNIDSLDAMERFLHSHVVPKRHALAEQFEFALRRLDEYSIPKYRLRYLLARLAQYVNAEAYGDDADDPLQPYLSSKVDIEHILPWAATAEMIAEFGGPEEAATRRSRLANLTLLEKPLNVVAADKPFKLKLPEYGKSKFLLTSGMNVDARVGKDTSVNRALENVHSYSTWTTVEFVDREERLLCLAGKIWGIPVSCAETTGA